MTVPISSLCAASDMILHLADGRKEEFYGSLKNEYEEQLKKFDFLFFSNVKQ